MKMVIATNKWFASADIRFDASFYCNEVNEYKLLLNKLPYSLGKVKDYASKIFYGGRAKRNYVSEPDRGIPFLSSSDMLKSDFSNVKYISKRLTGNKEELLLQKDWILISRSGTVGNTVYTNNDFVNKAGSEHIIRVIPNRDIKSGFLYSYLSSKFGYAFLTQGTFGAVIQHIEPEHIANIPVPIFPPEKQEAIHNLIVQAAELRVEANKMLANAISLFEEIIGKPEKDGSCQINSIAIKSVNVFQNRLDAQFQIARKKFQQEKKAELVYAKIKDLAIEINIGNRGKRNYTENGISFLSSSDMMLFNPKRYAKKISTKTLGINSLFVKRDTILISRSGTVGNTIIVGEDIQKTVVSEHAIRLTINESKIDPYYVYCYLNTLQGKDQLEASAFGSVIITLNEELIGDIDIPIVHKTEMDQIVSNTRRYLNKLDEAVKLENNAITLIETAISQWQQ